MLSTGIFGGSFNPLHNGHLALARHFLKAAALDEVWLVVSPQNPFKVNDTLLDDNKRLLMAQRAVEQESGLRVSDIEFHLPKPSYMWNTLQALSAREPQRQFTLLIGGDNWTRFDRWYHAADILNHYRLVVYPRQDDPIDPATLPHHVTLVEAPLLNISSTDIRRRIAQGLPVDHLVPPAILPLVTRYYRGA